MLLDSCTYDKIKLLHELSCLAWFIEKHALNDARQTGDKETEATLAVLKQDLEKHIMQLKKLTR